MTPHNNHTTLPLLAAMLLMWATFTGCTTTKQAGNRSSTSVLKAENMDNVGLLRRVNDNAVYAKNISAKVDVEADGRSLPVNTQLQMSSGSIIRLSLTALGLVEVGRLEFTPQYALIIDRVHKKYAKEEYSAIKFMKQNGLNFHMLESLLRNQLFLPAESSVGESNFAQFHVDNPASASQSDVNISHKAGKIDYTWNVDTRSALINKTLATYHGGTDGDATLEWNYSRFVYVGKKQFPTLHQLSLTLPADKARKRTMQFALSKIVTTGDYSQPTTPPTKYTKVDFDELFNRIMSSTGKP